jgi:hypothetical protein
MQGSGGNTLLHASKKISDLKRDCKDGDLNKFYSWSEFRIGLRKKRQYGMIFIKAIYKILTDDCSIEFEKLQDEELYLLKHIIEGIDVSDLKK